jgi:hypothetical protein
MICHTTDEVTSVQHFQRYVIKQTMCMFKRLTAFRKLKTQNSPPMAFGKILRR